MALDIKNLTVRSFSGIVYVGLIIGAILWGDIGVTILCSLFAVTGIYEMEHMASYRLSLKWRGGFFIDCLIALSVLWACIGISTDPAVSSINYLMICFALCLIAVRVMYQIFSKDEKGIITISISCFSVLYLTLPLMCFIVLENLFEGFGYLWMVVAAISMIWINDTGAYLVGCTFGRHRLYEALSPKKSWEGFFGGLIFNIGAGVGYYFIFRGAYQLNGNPVLSVLDWIVIGISVTVAATLGDLFESMIKRNFNVKDSGKLIPGHGGILDRIDSILFVMPVLLLLFYPLIEMCRHFDGLYGS